MRYAVVDIGSNTLKMTIYDVAEPKNPELVTVLSESVTLGLINYNRRKIMSAEGIEKLAETLETFKKLADNVSADVIYCFATASLRSIENSAEVISVVRDRTGLETDLISGENEALLGFEGLRCGLPESVECRQGLMVDLGGGSTELLGFIDKIAVRALSLPFGCLSLWRKYVSGILPDKDEIKKIRRFVSDSLSDIGWLGSYGNRVYLVGGTARALASIHAELNGVDAREHPVAGYTISGAEVADVLSRYKKPDKDAVGLLIRTVPDRLHTVIPGITVYSSIIGRMGEICGEEDDTEISVSTGGLREGYLLSKIRGVSQENEIQDENSPGQK